MHERRQTSLGLVEYVRSLGRPFPCGTLARARPGVSNFEKIFSESTGQFSDLPPSKLKLNHVNERLRWGEHREFPRGFGEKFFTKPRLGVIILIPNGGCGS